MDNKKKTNLPYSYAPMSFENDGVCFPLITINSDPPTGREERKYVVIPNDYFEEEVIKLDGVTLVPMKV